jgi:hypothetical protein
LTSTAKDSKDLRNKLKRLKRGATNANTKVVARNTTPKSTSSVT